MTILNDQMGRQVPEFVLNDRLAKARSHAAIDVEEMARMLGCSRRTISRWERAGTRVPRAVVIGYAVGCSVDLGWLEHGVPGDASARVALSYTPRDLNPEPTVHEIPPLVSLAAHRIRRASLRPERDGAA